MARDFAAWRDGVVASLATRPDVVGVAGLGSTAATSRADEWSDLDMFILVAAGAEDTYRRTLDWLPDAHDVVLHLVEWHGGAKVLFRDGRFIEWGVGTPEAVATWLAGEGVVLFDRKSEGAISTAEALESAQANPFPINDVSEENALATFVFAVHHGMGRVRRGEALSGGEIIRSEAVSALLRAARVGLEPTDPNMLDPIDVRRRVERAFPELAADLARAVAQEPERAAVALLAIAETHFSGQLNAEAMRAVRDRYAWNS